MDEFYVLIFLIDRPFEVTKVGNGVMVELVGENHGLFFPHSREQNKPLS